MREDGYLKIEGQNSTFYLGVTPQAAGFPAYQGIGGRLVTPNVQSFEMTVRYPDAPVANPLTAGTCSAERPLNLLARDRSSTATTMAALLSRCRSMKKAALSAFSSERRGGCAIGLR